MSRGKLNLTKELKNMSKNKGFANFIRSRREELGLSQEALAYKTNISFSYVAHIEAGRRRPSIHIIEKLADILQISRDELRQLAGYAPEKPIGVPSFDVPLEKLKELLAEIKDEVAIPILGSIKVRADSYVYDDFQGNILVRKEMAGCVALKVREKSLEKLSIFENDLVIIKPDSWQSGDLVVAFMDGDCCTVKKIFKAQGKWRLGISKEELLPESPVKIFGKVLEVRRRVF